MLDRMEARDAAWDGRFITGVLSTGIYCLPSCPARNPKPENVRFFQTPEAARGSGLRPCKRCRPDDFYRRHDPDQILVEELAAELRRDPGRFTSVGDLAISAGVGGSKLHRLCRRHFHETPHSLLQEARVQAACRLLESVETGVADIAFEVGFGSLSSFQEAFLRRIAMSPTEYRALRDSASFELRMPRSFQRDRAFAYLGRVPRNPCLRVDGDELVLAFLEGGQPVSLRARFVKSMARVGVEAEGETPPGSGLAAHHLLVRLLGLATEPGSFERRSRDWPELAGVVERRRGLRIPQTRDTFEGLVWIVIGQQINLKFACTLYGRFVDRFGAEAPLGLRTFPAAELVAAASLEELEELRLSRRKAQVILDLARRYADGSLDLTDLSATAAAERLLAISGLGPWSVGYFLMRGLGFADCVPSGDAGLRRALRRILSLEEPPDNQELDYLMERYAPYRSLATFHLWQSLEDES